jgi:hypothetical protein
VLITDVSTLRGGPAPRQTRTRKTSVCFMIRQEREIARASLAGVEGTRFQQVGSMVGPVPGSLGKADRYGTALSLAVSGERYVRTVGRSAYQTALLRCLIVAAGRLVSWRCRAHLLRSLASGSRGR